MVVEALRARADLQDELARVQGDLATVPSKEVQYIDISPRQTVSVSAALMILAFPR